MTEGHEDYLGDLWDLLPVDPTDFIEDTPTEDESEKTASSEWLFDHDADVNAHHTKFTNAEHDLVARHPLAVLDPLVCSEAEAAGLIADHKALPNDHHTKFTNAEHDLVARHPLAVLDPLVCSEAEAGVLIEDHRLLPAAHHTKFTAANARTAISNIFGADGKADADIDLDGNDLINGTVDGIDVGEMGNELIVYMLDDCGDTSTITNWVEGSDGLNPVDNQVYVKQGSHSMALGVDADKSGVDLAMWTNTTSYGDMSAYQNDWFYLWVYFDSVDYLLVSSAAIQMRIGSAAGDYIAFHFANTSVSVGWNLLKLDLDNSDSGAGTVDWSDITYVIFQIYTLTGNTNDFTAYLDSIMFVRPMAQNHLVNLRHKEDTLLPARLLVSKSMEFGTRVANADANITGYILIKDTAGNDRKLALID